MILPEQVLASPIFGITLTLGTFWIGQIVQTKTKWSSLHPMITSTILIILFLTVFKIDYKIYNSGGSMISFLLGPATIALAVPLINNLQVLKDNWQAIIVGVAVGSLSGIVSVIFIARFLQASLPVTLSLIPKSVTSPIAMEISKSLGGIPALTAIIVVVTGIFGAIIGHKLLRFFGVTDNIAIGLAMGASSHGLGTNRCLQENELQGAVSGLSIVLVGIATAVSAVVLAKLLL